MLWVTTFFLALLWVPGINASDPVKISNPIVIGEESKGSVGYLARIELNSPKEVEVALNRAEAVFLKNGLPVNVSPVSFVFHGPEVAIFFKDNYKKYKSIIDLAARLSAFQVIDIKVCETRMGVLGRHKSNLFPFVGTVPFGPREIERLLKEERYVYF